MLILATTTIATAAIFPINRTKCPIQLIVEAIKKLDDTNVKASLVA